MTKGTLIALLSTATLALAQDPNPNYRHVRSVDDNGNGVDSSTRSLQTITYEHHEIHAGYVDFLMEWYEHTNKD